MLWIQRHAWRLLLIITVLIAFIGVWPVLLGLKEDASVPLGIAGITATELEATSAAAYRLSDFQARTSGLDLIAMGILLSVVVLRGFRQNRPWAWWTMWTLPGWAAAVSVLILAVGVAPGQAPPNPMISGPIIAVLSAAILLVSVPRFFGQEPR
jgi:hypothetical protein